MLVTAPYTLARKPKSKIFCVQPSSICHLKAIEKCFQLEVAFKSWFIFRFFFWFIYQSLWSINIIFAHPPLPRDPRWPGLTGRHLGSPVTWAPEYIRALTLIMAQWTFHSSPENSKHEAVHPLYVSGLRHGLQKLQHGSPSWSQGGTEPWQLCGHLILWRCGV